MKKKKVGILCFVVLCVILWSAYLVEFPFKGFLAQTGPFY